MSALAYLGDVLVLAALALMTIGVFGIFRLPDVHTQIHAASKIVVIGIVMLVAASVSTRDVAIVARAALVGAAFLLTAPVGAHAIARAAYRTREPMLGPDSVDESGRIDDGRRPPGGSAAGGSSAARPH